MSCAAVVHGHGHLPLALAQRRLQALQHREVAAQRTELPLRVERLEQALQVAGRVVHVRLAHLDVVQVHDRIERDGTRVGGLAHHLAVHLAGRGHIDHQVALDLRGAGEAVARRQRAPARVALLGGTDAARDWRRWRRHAVLGEVALHDQHLAASAERASAAHRVDVDPEGARGLQQRRAERKASALARRREDDQCVGFAHAGPGCASGARPRGGRAPHPREPRRRRPRGLQRRGLAEALDPARAVRVVAHHDIRPHAGLDDLQVHRIHDRGGESRHRSPW